MGYRPIKIKGLKTATTKELIERVRVYLHEFTKTRAFDSGVRLSETEAYLQGLIDAQRTSKNA